MTATLSSVAGDDPWPRPDVSLSRFQEYLSRLDREFANTASRFDAALSDKSQTQPSVDAMLPPEYFTSLVAFHRIARRNVGNDLSNNIAWDIMLQLMLALVEGRELRGSELQTPGNVPEDMTHEVLDALVEAKLIDTFDNSDNVEDSFLAPSSEAARRMAEIYRARTRG